MDAVMFLPQYVAWHYSGALTESWGVITNFVWFVYHFFSVPVLLRTLLSPFHKLDATYKKGFNPAEFASTLLINTILRFVGLILRVIVLIFAAVTMIATLFVGVAFYVLWIALPVVLIGLLACGIYLLV